MLSNAPIVPSPSDAEDGEAPDLDALQRAVVSSDDAIPLHVTTQGATISKDGDVLIMRAQGTTLASARMIDVSAVCLYGGVQVSTQALNAFCRKQIPICHLSRSGQLIGVTQEIGSHGHLLRAWQHRVADDPMASLAIARRFVEAKIRNARVLLRRSASTTAGPVLAAMARLAEKAGRCDDPESLLGLEGAAAKAYFSAYPVMLKPSPRHAACFQFTGRNRRPPRDAVNALMSFAYTLLGSDALLAILQTGLDPGRGLLHQQRSGKPALALDLAEEFRPVIGDSVVLGLINRGGITPADFDSADGAVLLNADGRRKAIAAYERRLAETIIHPALGQSLSYRRIIAVQARLLARTLCGETEAYPAFRIR